MSQKELEKIVSDLNILFLSKHINYEIIKNRCFNLNCLTKYLIKNELKDNTVFIKIESILLSKLLFKQVAVKFFKESLLNNAYFNCVYALYNNSINDNSDYVKNTIQKVLKSILLYSSMDLKKKKSMIVNEIECHVSYMIIFLGELAKLGNVISIKIILSFLNKFSSFNSYDFKCSVFYLFKNIIKYVRNVNHLLIIGKYCVKNMNLAYPIMKYIVINLSKLWINHSKVKNLIKQVCLKGIDSGLVLYGELFGKLMFIIAEDDNKKKAFEKLLKIFTKKSNLASLRSIIVFLNHPSLSLDTKFILKEIFVLFKSPKMTKLLSILIRNISDQHKRPLIYLNNLINHISSEKKNIFLLITIVKEIIYLTDKLGELIIKSKSSIVETIFKCLKNKNVYIRYIGTICLRSIGKTNSENEVICLIGSLLTMVQMDHVEMIEEKESTMSKKNDRKISKNCYKLTGHSNALASLILLSSKNKLSISYLLSNATLDTASLLINVKKKLSSFEELVRRKSCFILISGLLNLNNFWLKTKIDKIFKIWDIILINSGKKKSKYSIRAVAYALFSVSIFLKRHYANDVYNVLSKERLKKIMKYIANSIAIISSYNKLLRASNEEENTTINSGVIKAVNILKMYLFQTVESLPESILVEQYSTVKYMTKLSFIESMKCNTKTSLLKTILEEDNNDDDFNDDLNNLPFEIEISLLLDPPDSVHNNKFESIDCQLINSAIKCLGKLFNYQKTSTFKSQIIDHLVEQIKLSRTSEKKSMFCYSSVISILYYILLNIKKDKEAQKYLSKIHSILNSTFGHKSIIIRKSGVKVLALLSKIIGEQVIKHLLKNCVGNILQKGPFISGCALALGYVNKSVGTFLSHLYLTSSVSCLQTLARSDNLETQIFSLQSLHYTIDYAGTGISPHIESIIQLLSILLFSTNKNAKKKYKIDNRVLINCSKILYSCIGLGPEIQKNSHFVTLFSFLLDKFISTEEEFDFIMESLILIQKTIIILPNLLNLDVIIPKLIVFLDNKKLIYQSSLCLKIITRIYPKKAFEYLKPKDIFLSYDNFPILIFRRILFCYIENEDLLSLEEWVGIFEDLIFNQKSHTFWEKKLLALSCIEKIICDTSKNLKIDYEIISKFIHLSTFVVTKEYVLPSIQKKGIEILVNILKKFKVTVSDSIHFGTVIGVGLKNKTISPSIISLTCELLNLFVSSKMLNLTDNTATTPRSGIDRILNHLFKFLPELIQIKFHNYGEISSTMVKLSILTSLAKIVIKSNKNCLHLFDKYSLLSLDYWGKVLEDYCQLDYTGEKDSHGFEYFCVLEKKPMIFYEEGTEKEVRNFYEQSYSYILNALTKISQKKEVLNDPTLLIGLAVRDLLEKKNSIISLDSLIRIVPSKQYQSLQNVKEFTVEIITLLLRLTKKDLELAFQSKLLKLLKIIIKNIQPQFFLSDKVGSKSISHVDDDSKIILDQEEIVLIIIKIVHKILQTHFPYLFIPEEEIEGKRYEINVDQQKLIKRSMNCFKHIINKVEKINDKKCLNMILFICYKLIVFSNHESCVKTLSLLINNIKKHKNEDFYKDSLLSIFECFRKRINSNFIQSYLEIEFLFICLSITTNQKIFQESHELISLSLINYINVNKKDIHKLNMMIKGIQNGILFLGRHSDVQLTLYYLNKVIGEIFYVLQRIIRIKVEDNVLIISELITYSLNVLLVGLQLIEKEKKLTYLYMIIPLLFLILKFVNTNNIKKLKQLCKECIERIAKSETENFSKTIQRMPENIVNEIKTILSENQNEDQQKSTPSSQKKKKKKIEL